MPFYNISSDCYPYYAFSTRICETTYDDGFLHNEQGHPRAAGTFPRLIDKYVKTGKLSLVIKEIYLREATLILLFFLMMR